MIFNTHSNLQGSHAFLSASKYHWIRYDDDKLIKYFETQQAAALGSELHEIAASLIKRRIKLPRNGLTMSRYVNDAIGFGMIPEQVLFVSIVCFGTADAISFKDGVLRIHDLKTGTSRASFDQLMLYAAMFCIEYEIIPGDIEVRMRIYQNDDQEERLLPLEDLVHTISKVNSSVKLVEKLRSETA